MELTTLQETWNALGQSDPFWAILSEPDKAGNRWEVAEFFRTGENEIDSVLGYITSLGVHVRAGKALDFGCGAGRLSQALCRYFDSCDGVDIAPSMIELAHGFNKFADRCRYHLNSRNDLRLFDDDAFDFIYCNIVLQHMEPKYSTAYIAEFLRVLNNDGVAIFQVPAPMPLMDTPADAPRVALPTSGFRAKLRILDAPVRIRPGSRHLITVLVRNLSDCRWPGLDDAGDMHPVRVGNRWYREAEGLAIEDTGRADWPGRLAPGEEISVQLVVTAPRAAGAFRLEVDLVQEHVAWFRDRGSFAAQAAVHVEGPSDATTEPNVLIPVIEMHGVAPELIREVVFANGGEMIDVREDDWAGASWRSFTYCIRKRR